MMPVANESGLAVLGCPDLGLHEEFASQGPRVVVDPNQLTLGMGYAGESANKCYSCRDAKRYALRQASTGCCVPSGRPLGRRESFHLGLFTNFLRGSIAPVLLVN